MSVFRLDCRRREPDGGVRVIPTEVAAERVGVVDDRTAPDVERPAP